MVDIQVAGITKKFSGSVDESQALTDISFTVPSGMFLSIIGASGSGKSTLLRIIGGLLGSTSGGVHIGDRLVLAPPPRTVYLFQHYTRSLFAWKSVLGNVVVGVQSRERGMPATSGQFGRKAALRDVAMQFLDQVDLSEFAGYYPHQLSGGMQQRLAIARALAAEPETLLMDEPFSAVDALTRMDLQDLILSLWTSRPITIILVTHDIDEAIYLSDRILVLHRAGKGFLTDMHLDLPRPREQLSTREIPAYGEYRRQLHRLLTKKEPESEGVSSVAMEYVNRSPERG